MPLGDGVGKANVGTGGTLGGRVDGGEVVSAGESEGIGVGEGVGVGTGGTVFSQ